MYIAPSLPSLDELKQAKLAMPLQIYTKDNQLVGQYGNTMSLPVTYEQIPKNMVNAFLAAEDSAFFNIAVLVLKGLGEPNQVDEDTKLELALQSLTGCKKLFLASERTINRKLTELFLARKIEEKLSKRNFNPVR